MAELLYQLKNISFTYPGDVKAVEDMSLDIFAGEKIALIGANGTGKSTLLTLLDALIFPQSGSIELGGSELSEKKLRRAKDQRLFREKVGFVFQNPDIQLFCPTVREDIIFGPVQFDVPEEVINSRLEAIASRLGIEHLLQRSPYQLSIGEKKKAAIASVLIIEPEVLLLDEPTAGLDPGTTREIIKVLEEEHAAGKTIIMATHDLHIVEEIADSIHVFGPERKIIRSGSCEEILSDHEFLQEYNLMHKHSDKLLHRPNSDKK